MLCVPCQEVITHERVVAMMKAAIRDTQDLPMFVSVHVVFVMLFVVFLTSRTERVCSVRPSVFEPVCLPSGAKDDSIQTETGRTAGTGELNPPQSSLML